MPLEGLWWADDMSTFVSNDKSNWKWTMMIMQPHFIDVEVISSAMQNVIRTKAFPAVERLRLENFTEGLWAQVIHVGPFSEEGPTIERVHKFIAARSALTGKHHEIYLSDTRRANLANCKTIIRQQLAALDPKHLPVAGDGECDAGRLVVHEQPFPIRAERRTSPF